MEQEILQGSMKHIAERGIAAYCDDRIAFIEDINKASRITGAVRMEIMIAVLCLKGKARLELDGETHIVEANDLLICHPNIILEKAWQVSISSSAASPCRPNTSANCPS